METTWRWILITAIAPIAWGSTYFVTRYALPADAPLWGAVLRALPAGLVLLLIARRLPRGAWWWRSLVLGTLNIGAFFVLVYLASTLLPASLASTVMATSAAVILLLAWPLLGQRPRLRAALGALVGFAGVAAMLLDPGLFGGPGAGAGVVGSGGFGSGVGGSGAAGSGVVGSAPGVNGWGVAASLAAMLMSSTGFLLATRWSRPAAPAPPIPASGSAPPAGAPTAPAPLAPTPPAVAPTPASAASTAPPLLAPTPPAVASTPAAAASTAAPLPESATTPTQPAATSAASPATASAAVPGVPPVLASTAWQLLAGGLVVLPFAAIVEGPPPALEPTALLAFGYVSLIATALAFVAWFAGLRHLPAGTVGLVGLLNPVTGVLLGTLLAAEPFAWPQALGTALVLTGVLLGIRRSRPNPDSTSSSNPDSTSTSNPDSTSSSSSRSNPDSTSNPSSSPAPATPIPAPATPIPAPATPIPGRATPDPAPIPADTPPEFRTETKNLPPAGR